MRKPFITVRLTHGMLGALLVSTCACSGSYLQRRSPDAILVSMLCNYQLMRLVGEDGISAYGVLMLKIMG